MIKLRKKSIFQKNGFTLIDVLVGVFLVSIIFLAIYGAYQLNLLAVRQSKSRILATAIAVGEIEKIKNLSYGSIGILNGFPDGVLESATTTQQNGIIFNIDKSVDFVVDSVDGIVSPEDDCPNDYKRVQVKVSWSLNSVLHGQVVSVTDVSPKNLAEECSTGGGILSVSVFDAFGNMIISPFIQIKNYLTGEIVNSFSPDTGAHYFSLATSTYQVLVSKDGYSSARTYSTDEVASPDKSNPLILEGQLTELSFSIDKLSSLSVFTVSSHGADYFFDNLNDENKISDKSDLIIKDGSAELATDTLGYLPSGYLVSQEIIPSGLVSWDKFSFSDSKPSYTDLVYKIYFATDTLWSLVPESALPGNSSGLSSSPVDLSALYVADYPKLKIRAEFSSAFSSTTPSLYDWQIFWENNHETVIPNAEFLLHGDKIIGKDSSEKPVYKYSIATTTDSLGKKDLSSVEWDSYTFSVDGSSGIDLVATDPFSQPISLVPDSSVSVKLYLDSQNSLLVAVQNSIDLGAIFAASVRVYNNTLGYDNTLFTDSNGQAYFIPLAVGTYNLEISATNYLSTSSSIYVSGDKIKTLKVNPD